MNIYRTQIEPVRCLALILVALALTAADPSVAEATNTADTAKAFVGALVARDSARAIQLLDDDAVLEMPYPLAPGENKYGTRRMWGDALRAYVNGIVERNSKIAFENMVWYATGADTVILECDGDLVRSKDGKQYRNKYIIVFKTSEGKIKTWREYFNPVVAARAFNIPLESLPY